MAERAVKQRGKLGGRRPGSGRKPIGVQRAIIIPNDVWQAVADRAAESGMTRPAWLRQVITAAAKQTANDT